MNASRLLMLACLLAPVAGCGAPVAEPGPPAVEAMREQVAAGREVAAVRCATCHAIGRESQSPNAAAPRFRDLDQRYDLAVLREEFAAGVHVGPGEMPTFALRVEEADALIAYLDSVD